MTRATRAIASTLMQTAFFAAGALKHLSGAILLLGGLSLGLTGLASPSAAAVKWERVAGAAYDIAVAGDGTVWAIGTTKAPGGYRIYRTNPGSNKWTVLPGAALRIAVEGKTPWVVNSGGSIYRWNGRQWQGIAGPKAVDIGASAKGVWIIAAPKQNNNYAIYKWTGKTWSKVSGGAVRVDVDANGNPWVVNSGGQLWALVANRWRMFRSAPAADLSVQTFGAPWIVAKTGAVWHFNTKTNKWENEGAGARAIARRGNQLWHLGARQEILRNTVPSATAVASAPAATKPTAAKSAAMTKSGATTKSAATTPSGSVAAPQPTTATSGPQPTVSGTMLPGVTAGPTATSPKTQSAAVTPSAPATTQQSLGPAPAGWERIAGAARDIAIASSGTLWIIGNNKANGGYRIYKSSPTSINWTALPGAALRIAVEGEAPWVVNDRGRIYRWNGKQWHHIAGPKALAIGANAKGVWLAAEPKRGNDYTIYQRTGSKWKPMAWTGVRLDVDANGNPWVVNSAGAVKVYVNGKWASYGLSRGETASDIAVDTFNQPWVVGKNGAVWYFNLKSKQPAKWENHGGAARAIAQRGGQMWYVGVKQDILRYKPTPQNIVITLANQNLNIPRPPIAVQSPQLNIPQPPVAVQPPNLNVPNQTLTVTQSTITPPLNVNPNVNTNLQISSKIDPNANQKLVISSNPANLSGSNTNIQVGGCIANTTNPACDVARPPSASLQGKLICPIISGTPAIMRKPCERLGAQAQYLGTGTSNEDCGKKYHGSPGFGAAFYDPRGECWACPVGYARTWAPVDAPANALLQACGAQLVWDAPQYPEPGTFAFLVDLINGTVQSPLIKMAFADPERVKKFIRARAKNQANVERDLWTQMIRSPGDSAEFKALIFAAMETVLGAQAAGQVPAPLRRFRDYIQMRRGFVIVEARRIYDAWRGVDAYKQSQALRQTIAAGGHVGPLVDILGTFPVDSLGYAWAAAVPDKAGSAFLQAVYDLSAMASSGQLGAATSGQFSFSTAYLLPVLKSMDTVSAAKNIIDKAGKIITSQNVNILKNIVNTKAFEGGSAALSIVGALVDTGMGIWALVAQAEAEKQLKDAEGAAKKPVDLVKLSVNERLLYWALATSRYKEGPKLGEGQITGCKSGDFGCGFAQSVVAQAAKAAGYDQAFVAQALGK